MASTKSIKIEDSAHTALKKHCKKQGIKIEKYASDAVLEKLAREKKASQ